MEPQTYREKLIDPRWQKLRLKIMERDGWGCTVCGATDKPLHVHHVKYEQGKDPWDYPLDTLVTACYKCHKMIHMEIAATEKYGEEWENAVCPEMVIDLLEANGWRGRDFFRLWLCLNRLMATGCSVDRRTILSLLNPEQDFGASVHGIPAVTD